MNLPALSNEALFLIVMAMGILSIPFAAWRGQAWLQGLIVMLGLFLGITDGKVIEVFGLPTTLGTALYVTNFLAADVLTEVHGRKVAYDTVRIAVFTAILFQIYLLAVRLTVPVADVTALSGAMEVVFGTSLRLVAAGMLVYYLSQTLDVFLYARIRQWTGGRYLWLRNNLSTLISQLFDTFAFAFLAFYGVFDGWAQLALVSYAVKAIVVVVDTPFAYLSRWAARRSQATDHKFRSG